MTSGRTAAIVLAAGKGTRMKSDLPKVLHPVAGRAMIEHVMTALGRVAPERTVVVVGPGMSQVAEAVAPAATAVQPEPLGTGHAVLAARERMDGFEGDVLVLFGDTPLLTAETIAAMVAARRAPGGPAVVVLGFRPDDPAEYGRLIADPEGRLDAIVEYRDATPEERRIGLCNAGIMAIDGKVLFPLLDAVGNDNAKGEYYLTDIVGIARARQMTCAVVEAPDPAEVMGVNSRAELAAAEGAMQRRLRARALANGATMIDPDSVWLSADTEIGRDVTIGPHVVFGKGVRIADEVEIKPFCHFEKAVIEKGAEVGPFARLRPGARIGPGAKIGNFVEIKATTVEAGAKVNHLSYIGDARVGEKANVGAGTITCNYDGFFKDVTDIGAGAFIGSNTALVAPVRIGAGAFIAAGSVITSEVPADALAIARGRQSAREGWAKAFRERRQSEKAAARKNEK